MTTVITSRPAGMSYAEYTRVRSDNQQRIRQYLKGYGARHSSPVYDRNGKIKKADN